VANTWPKITARDVYAMVRNGKERKNCDFSSVAATFEKAITYVFAGRLIRNAEVNRPSFLEVSAGRRLYRWRKRAQPSLSWLTPAQTGDICLLLLRARTALGFSWALFSGERKLTEGQGINPNSCNLLLVEVCKLLIKARLVASVELLSQAGHS
jgi:hypothetical protein